MSEAIISVKDLRVQYGDFVLFDDLEFQVNKKDIFIIMGASGCGKSSLLKVLTGLVKPIKGEILINGLTLNDKENPKVNEEIMKTSGIREDDGKGRHTTTYRHLFVLDNGVTIIDTPGMREIAVCGIDEGIDDTFSDITELFSQCRFSNCRHDTEPNCAVKKALETGKLSEKRWRLYQRLYDENFKAKRMKAGYRK